MCGALGTEKLFMSSFQGFKWNFPPVVLMQPWLWSHSGGYKNVIEQKKGIICSFQFHYYLKRFDSFYTSEWLSSPIVANGLSVISYQVSSVSAPRSCAWQELQTEHRLNHSIRSMCLLSRFCNIFRILLLFHRTWWWKMMLLCIWKGLKSRSKQRQSQHNKCFSK